MNQVSGTLQESLLSETDGARHRSAIPATTCLPHGSRPVGLGLVGLGAFGRFCLQAYLQMPEVQFVALADLEPAAREVGLQHAPAARAYADAAPLVADPDVQVVAICTPPDRQLAVALASILAGKHVLCDKPLGISLHEFDTAVAAAATHGVALGLNLVLRHHPLYRALLGIARAGDLGRVRRLAVENYADEAVGRDHTHWLWDPARSGGLALAADIHWLDLATRLLGPAHAVQAWAPAGEDNRQCHLLTTTHGGAVASIYHAFTTRPEAQGCTVLVAFEEGEARLEGWVPRRLTLACPADRRAAVQARLGPLARSERRGGDPRRVLLCAPRNDPRSAYQMMIQDALRAVLAMARGEAVDLELPAARHATVLALAAATSASTQQWVPMGDDEPFTATG